MKTILLIMILIIIISKLLDWPLHPLYSSVYLGRPFHVSFSLLTSHLPLCAFFFTCRKGHNGIHIIHNKMLGILAV